MAALIQTPPAPARLIAVRWFRTRGGQRERMTRLYSSMPAAIACARKHRAAGHDPVAIYTAPAPQWSEVDAP